MFCYTRFFSRVAQNAVNFALVLLIVDETGLAFMSSLMVLALVVPSTLAGIVAGSAADVLPKRLLVFLGNLARAGVCLLVVQGASSTASLYLVAVALATAQQFAALAEGAIQPLIVERHELAQANAIGQAVGGAAQILGLGVLTPVVLRLFDSPQVLFGIALVLFLIAAGVAPAIGRVRGVERPQVVGGGAEGRWWAAGWRAMRADPAVMQAAVELTLLGATLIILGGLIPKYISDTLGLPFDLGAIVLIPAVFGVALGLRVAGALAHRVPHALLSSGGFGVFVVCLGALTFVNDEASFLSGYGMFAWLDQVNIGNFDRGGVLAMAIMFPAGFAFAIVNVAAQTVINHRVPLQLQGRVGATQNAMAAVASSVPVIGAGLLADAVGVTPVMAIVAILIGAAAVANLRAPHLRGGAVAHTPH
ncbi:MAG: MFS transporter [Dehalococcoidia bacterium]